MALYKTTGTGLGDPPYTKVRLGVNKYGYKNPRWNAKLSKYSGYKEPEYFTNEMVEYHRIEKGLDPFYVRPEVKPKPIVTPPKNFVEMKPDQKTQVQTQQKSSDASSVRSGGTGQPKTKTQQIVPDDGKNKPLVKEGYNSYWDDKS